MTAVGAEFTGGCPLLFPPDDPPQPLMSRAMAAQVIRLLMCLSLWMNRRRARYSAGSAFSILVFCFIRPDGEVIQSLNSVQSPMVTR